MSDRPSPSCSTCDFMRHEGGTMRCYFDPPAPALLGTIPSKLQGLPPQMVVTGISPEVHAQRFCQHHPDLRDLALIPVIEREAPQPQPIEARADGETAH